MQNPTGKPEYHAGGDPLSSPGRVRPLVPGDLQACHGLSTEAGWNQILADWRFILENSTAIGIEVPGEGIVATSIAMGGPGSRWIAMVLVAPAWRGQGFASRLLKELRAGADPDCRDGLDATDSGATLYAKLGFVPEQVMVRFKGQAPHAATAPSPVPATCRALADSPELAVTACAWEEAAAGLACRPAILNHLQGAAPSSCLVRMQAAKKGAIWARPGRLAWQLGPLVAADLDTALVLLDACMATIPGPVMIDVPESSAAFIGQLALRGFSQERQFTRMFAAAHPPQPASALQRFATAGPEFG